MMAMKSCKFLCLAFVSLMVMSCSEIDVEHTLEENETLELSDIQFDKNYKNFKVRHFTETCFIRLFTKFNHFINIFF